MTGHVARRRPLQRGVIKFIPLMRIDRAAAAAARVSGTRRGAFGAPAGRASHGGSARRPQTVTPSGHRRPPAITDGRSGL